MKWQVIAKRKEGASEFRSVKDFPTKRAAAGIAQVASGHSPGTTAEVWRWEHDKGEIVAKYWQDSDGVQHQV